MFTEDPVKVLSADPGVGGLGSWSLRSFNLNLGEKIWEAVGPASPGGGDVVGCVCWGVHRRK